MGWLLGIKSYLIAAVVAGLLIGAWVYTAGAEKAKSRVIVLESMLAHAESAARQNATAFDECQKANAANKTEADAQRIRAIDAEKRTAALTALADRGAREVEREATVYRAVGLECPAITADFRRWMRSGS